MSARKRASKQLLFNSNAPSCSFESVLRTAAVDGRIGGAIVGGPTNRRRGAALVLPIFGGCELDDSGAGGGGGGSGPVSSPSSRALIALDVVRSLRGGNCRRDGAGVGGKTLRFVAIFFGAVVVVVFDCGLFRADGGFLARFEIVEAVFLTGIATGGNFGCGRNGSRSRRSVSSPIRI